MMRRGIRLFISLALGLLVAPLIAGTQTAGKITQIGYLAASALNFAALQQELRELGWVEGQNITFESRVAEGDLDQLHELAAELVRLKLDGSFYYRYT
jgi:putative tryptophan/tyrosine transport system substrate-binding protein